MLLLDLPDEVLLSVGKWVSCFELKDFAHFRSSNQRLHKLLSQPEVFSSVLDIRCKVDTTASSQQQHQQHYRATIDSLARLHLYEIVRDAGLLEENRAGFDYGSPTVLEEDFDTNGDTTYILGSRARLDTIQEILRRYKNTFGVLVDAHSGLGAPSLRLAQHMSRARGLGICHHWFREFVMTSSSDNDDDVDHDSDDDDDDGPEEPSPVQMCAWSLDAAHAAFHSDHPYKENAATGRGWAELRLFLKGRHADCEFTMPPRPDFYQDLLPLEIIQVRHESEEADDDDDGYGAIHSMIVEMVNDSSDDEEVDSSDDDEEEEDFISSDDDDENDEMSEEDAMMESASN